MKLSWLQNNH